MAAKAGGGGSGGGEESMMAFAVLFAIIVMVGVPAFYFAHKNGINFVLLLIAKLELSPFAFVFSRARHVLDIINSRPPQSFTWPQVKLILTIAGSYFRWLLAPVMLGAAFVFYKSYGWAENFRRSFNMKSLLQHNAKRFALLSPVANRKRGSLLKESPSKGPWRVAESPMLFALRNNIIVYEEPASKKNPEGQLLPVPEKWCYQDNGLPRNRPHVPKGGYRFDMKRAIEVYADSDRMGPAFDVKMFKNKVYPTYIRGLVGALCALALGHRGAGEKILDAMNLSYVEEDAIATHNASGVPVKDFNLDIADADEWIERALRARPADASSTEDNLQSQLMMNFENHDVFLYTWIAALLETARAHAGSIPPSEFLWLRPTNRPLWYFLNSLGGNSVHTEGGGPWAHYRAENILHNSIPTAVVDYTAKALQSAIEDEGWFDKGKENPNDN